MSNETVNPKELADNHRNAHDKLERAKRVQDRIHQSGLIKRGISKAKGNTSAAHKGVEEAQKVFDATLQIPKEQIDVIEGRVNEVRATKRAYEAERQRVIQEIAPQYKQRVASIGWPGEAINEQTYIDDYEGLATNDEKVSPIDLAKALAVRDIFFPIVDNPGYAGMTFRIGDGPSRRELAVSNGNRFPNFEIGSDEIEDAVGVANTNGWQNIVKMSVDVTINNIPKDGEEPDKIKLTEKSAFTAVSDETAKLLELAIPVMNSSSDLSVAFGRNRGMSTVTSRQIEFSALSVSEVHPIVAQTA